VSDTDEVKKALPQAACFSGRYCSLARAQTNSLRYHLHHVRRWAGAGSANC